MKQRLLLALAAAMTCASAQAAEPVSGPRQAFLDHIAYVATFTMPIVIEKCTAIDPDYLVPAASAYFRFANARQDQIERGRLLTLAELRPEQSLHDYRREVVASRLGRLDNGSAEDKQRVCQGALAMLTGAAMPPGEWP